MEAKQRNKIVLLLSLSCGLFFSFCIKQNVAYSDTPATAVSDIEETSSWTNASKQLTDGFPNIPPSPGAIGTDTTDKKTGAFAMFFKGSRNTQNRHSLSLTLKPSTKYKLSAWVKIKDRATYNYLEVTPPYPAAYTDINSSSKMLKQTKGIWSGRFFVQLHIKERREPTLNTDLLQPNFDKKPMICNSDKDWYQEELFFKTPQEIESASLFVQTVGFDGKLYLDGVTLEEVDSFIEDKYLHIPIEYEFQGMKIEEISQNPLFVKTNAAKFLFEQENIVLEKDGAVVGSIVFPGEQFLSNLTVNREPGIVILENGFITISIGADSSLIAKLKSDAQLTAKGPRPSYHNFEAGIIFVSDYEKGMLFSPVYPDSIIKNMPFAVNSDIIDYTYNDEELESYGIKNWDILKGFSENEWEIGYSFGRGEAFIISVFPPKDFDQSKYNTERVNFAYTLNLNTYPEADYSYYLQKFSEYYNIALLEADSYAASINTQNPPAKYFLDINGNPVSPSDPARVNSADICQAEVSGPYTIHQEEATKRLVEEAHGRGLKVILYLYPHGYYTSNVDTILDNLKYNISKFNFDGVYLDGLFNDRPLKSLELVRKVRSFLKDKFYIQHNSATRTLIAVSDRFRVPLYDAWADKLWVGENMKKVDENTFRLNYCGLNVSNTITQLLPEIRQVDYSKTVEENKNESMQPEQQIDMQLKHKGEFRIIPFVYKSSLYDMHFRTRIEFNPKYYWDRIDAYSLPYTRGNGAVEPGETIYNAPEDCAPQNENITFTKLGETYKCNTGYSIAQWIADGNPLYKLHFTFDVDIARDDSNNRMNPSYYMGLLFRAPEPRIIDGRRCHGFNSSTELFGYSYGELDLTDKDFSSFAAVKITDRSQRQKTIFSLWQRPGQEAKEKVYYGLKGRKAFVIAKNTDGDEIEVVSTDDNAIDDFRKWHTIGIVYRKPFLSLYVDGVKQKEVAINALGWERNTDFNYCVAKAIPGDSERYFEGYIDDLFLTQTALTEDQIKQYHRHLHKAIELPGREAQCVVVDENGKKYSAKWVPGLYPFELAAQAASLNDIRLTWQDNSDKELGFKIERSLGPEDGFIQIASVPANNTSYLNTNLPAGRRYYYKIQAYNNEGYCEYSNTVSASTLIKPPSGLYAEKLSGSMANISWQDNSVNEQGFKIERSVSPETGFIQIGTTPVNISSYMDGLQRDPGIEAYYYRVRAFNDSGDSAYSSVAFASLSPCSPSDLTAAPASENQINLSWKDNSNYENGFIIERRRAGQSSFAQIAEIGSNVNSYNDVNLPKGAKYYYRIKAFNDIGDSEYSNIACAIPQDPAAIVLNPDIEEGSTIPANWKTYNNTLNRGTGWVTEDSRSATHSLKIINNGRNAYWKGALVKFESLLTGKITLKGWIKTRNVSKDTRYLGVWLRVDFENGEYEWLKEDLQVKTGINDWRMLIISKSFDKPIKSIQPYCIFYGGTGEAWFDDINVRIR